MVVFLSREKTYLFFSASSPGTGGSRKKLEASLPKHSEGVHALFGGLVI
jgi:hypothetical protein